MGMNVLHLQQEEIKENSIENESESESEISDVPKKKDLKNIDYTMGMNVLHLQ